MREFIHKLVARLTDARRPLSRNRHYDTFANPQGRRALRLSRQLRSLAKDIVEQRRKGAEIHVQRSEGPEGLRVLLEFVQLKARRTAFLSAEEFELLLHNPGVREALEGE